MAEMTEERGILVDHSSINRWTIRFLLLIEKMARKHKCLVGGSWRMYETCIKVKGAIKPVTRPIFNFKSFRAAGSVLASVELMHMIRKE